MIYYKDTGHNDTLAEERCYEIENILQSEFPEVFWAGITCILFNFILFASWV